jgi:hypothetical protein
MAANGIITGTGGNNFSPRATTPAEEAALYASATRERALAIAVRIADNLKDKPLDYTQGGQQATPSPSGNVDHAIIGVWSSGISNIGDWHNSITGNYISTLGSVYGIEFKADGTFNSVSITVGTTLGGHQDLFKGNFKVEGNKIYLTNVMNKFTGVDKNNQIRNDSHDYKPFENHILSFEIFDHNGSECITFDYVNYETVGSGIYFGNSNMLYRITE